MASASSYGTTPRRRTSSSRDDDAYRSPFIYADVMSKFSICCFTSAMN
jgi:hypothetical protein